MKIGANLVDKKNKLPESRILLICFDERNLSFFIGYFSKDLNSWFDKNGTGVFVSHWQYVQNLKNV